MSSYQGNAPIANNNYGVANGTNSTSPLLTVIMTRDPTSNDINYQVKQRWVNSSQHREWILTGFTQSNNTTVSNWLQLSDGDALTQIGVPNGTSPITPDANGLINFTSSAGSVTITGSAGGTGAQNINFDVANYTTGLWTPNLQIGLSSTGITYTSQLGGYTRIGNVVLFWVFIQLSSKGVGSGAVTISNFPVAASTNGPNEAVSVSEFSNLSIVGYISAGLQFNSSSTQGNFVVSATTGSASLMLDTNLTNTSLFKFSGSYILD